MVVSLLYGHSHQRPPLLSGQISDALKFQSSVVPQHLVSDNLIGCLKVTFTWFR
jgi:hypothetical protein